MADFRLCAVLLVVLAGPAQAQNVLDNPLPEGWGNSTRGLFAFKHHCSRCHSLHDTYAPAQPIGSCFTDGVRLFHYLRHQMPRDAKDTLTDVETYSLIAYILATKSIIGSNAIINRATLPLVVIPNSGFIPAGCPVEAGGHGGDKFAPKPEDAKLIPAPPPLRAVVPPPAAVRPAAAPAPSRAKPAPKQAVQ